jgi:hypothetical protein
MDRPLAKLLIVAALSFYSTSGIAQSLCFQRDDNRRMSYDVFQISFPPKFSPQAGDYADDSPVYPASDYATISMKSLKEMSPASKSGFSFRKHYLLWANRCIHIEGTTPSEEACRNTVRTKGNGYPEMLRGDLKDQLRTAYSTYAKADACTLISASKVLGEPQAVLEAAAKADGLELVTAGASERERLKAVARSVTAKNGESTNYLVDVCVVESNVLASDTAGIVLDYEVWDSRTPVEAISLMTRLRDLVHKHGKTFIVTTNPIPRPPNGISGESARAILDLADGFATTIASGASPGNPSTYARQRDRQRSVVEDYRLQLAELTDRGKHPLSAKQRAKLIWNISLFDTQLDEARELHDEFKRQGYRGVMIFRNFVRQGGACSRTENQVTSCLTLGACDGKFGSTRSSAHP